MENILDILSKYNEPSIDFKMRKYLSNDILSKDEEDELLKKIKNSVRVNKLLTEQNDTGIITHHPYSKWYGTHWVLSCLADLEYPPKDIRIKPLIEQIYNWLLSDEYKKHWKIVSGKIRTHPCQIGNALYYINKLGFNDNRADNLAEWLIDWQWEDGGWNCDRKPKAKKSSFLSTVLAMRGLNEYNKNKKDSHIKDALNRAAHILVERELFKRLTDNSIIDSHFLQLFYPTYYHYNILFGLKVLVEMDYPYNVKLDTPINLLLTKQLPNLGFPAERKYYVVTDFEKTGKSLISWGTVNKNLMNEFITLDALIVLKHYNKI